MRVSIVSLFILISGAIFAQEADSVYRHHLPFLQDYGQRILTEMNLEDRVAAADTFQSVLGIVCNYPEAIDFTFEGVSNMSVIQSPDGQLKLMTFMVPQENLTYHHRGMMLYRDDETFKKVPLFDNTRGGRELQYRLLSPANWYGSLYYDIIEEEVEDQTVYFLLGYRSINAQIQQKLIDAVTVTEGLVRFGSKSFKVEEFNDVRNPNAPYRLMLSYSAKNGAMLRWDDEYEGIIMDHLSPPDASMRGLYMEYGPDFSYDGLRWEDENWILERGIRVQSDIEPQPRRRQPENDLSPDDN